MKQRNKEIEKHYKNHLTEASLKNLNIKLAVGILILFYFVFSDLYLRHNILAFYTRIFPISIGVFLFVFNLITNQYQYTKAKLYNLFLFSLPIMMFGKCLVHINETALASAVSGTILVIFLISLDIKTSLRNTIIIYAIPVILFIIVIGLFFNLSTEQYLLLSNIYPIVILGYIANRIQDRLRYKSFESNYLLAIEKQRVEQLYEETQTQNEKINKVAKELKKLNSTKNKFFSIIAHDLKNQFNAILGYSELLKKGLNNLNTVQFEKYVNIINKTSKQTYNLLLDLLEWASAQSDEINYNPEKLLLNKVINDSIKLFEEQADKKKISLIYNEQTDIYVFADLYMLNTILRNLISNAIKFTPSGKIEISTAKTTDKCEITIIDSGIGISKEKIKNLFKIDKVTSSVGTNGETGTGIGLSLCKEFITKHKGSIFAESVENKGSKFTFTISCYKNDYENK
ncbi:MAG: hypothetical protein GXO79_02140 [Chlorobi bacterium]|nr:hypothetical protein [Chlorobiota bacterium]